MKREIDRYIEKEKDIEFNHKELTETKEPAQEKLDYMKPGSNPAAVKNLRELV